MNSFLFSFASLQAPGWCSVEWLQSKQEGRCLQVSRLRVQKQLWQAQSPRWSLTFYHLTFALCIIQRTDTEQAHMLQNMQEVCRLLLCVFFLYGMFSSRLTLNMKLQVDLISLSCWCVSFFTQCIWKCVLFFNPQIPSVFQMLKMLIATCPLVWLWPGDLPPLVWWYVCVCLCGEENYQEVCQCSVYDDSSRN